MKRYKVEMTEIMTYEVETKADTVEEAERIFKYRHDHESAGISWFKTFPLTVTKISEE